VTAVVEALAALNARLSPEDRTLIVRCVVSGRLGTEAPVAGACG
jgi:hypothetical protein